MDNVKKFKKIRRAMRIINIILAMIFVAALIMVIYK
jgi:hypothetical protein